MGFNVRKATGGLIWCAIVAVSFPACNYLYRPENADLESDVVGVLVAAVLYVTVGIALVKAGRKLNSVKATYISFAIGYAVAAAALALWGACRAVNPTDCIWSGNVLLIVPGSIVLGDPGPRLLAQVTAMAVAMLLNGVCYAIVLVSLLLIARKI